MNFYLGFVEKIREPFEAVARRWSQLQERGPAQARMWCIDNDQ